MKRLNSSLISVLLLAGTMAGCSTTGSKSPDVAGDIRKSLDGAGLKDVSVSQDREKGVVTLSGHVPSDFDKTQAESIARSAAGQQVVSDQVAVLPPGAEKDAKRMDADLDKGIDKNLDAALVQKGLQKGISYDVKKGVVTLKGEVRSQAQRRNVQEIAASVPNVMQVVNELQVKGQKATSSN
jgi:hyperosmotically inducible protein